MFQAIMLIFRKSHYCIQAACCIITLKTSEWSITRVGTLIVATIYLQLIQNRYMF